MATRALPPRFLERLTDIVPEDRFEGVVKSFAAPQRVGFRVNRLKTTPAQILAALRAEGLEPAPVPWYPDAFTLPAEDRPRLLAGLAYERQEIYLQNLSSMVPPLALEVVPGERVLDLAAAPGSKTLQLAGMMQGEGELAAVEIVPARFHKLRANLAAQGASWVRTFLQDGMKVWRYRPDHFDRVLLDAPCSTEGRFREDDPETYRYWSERKIREMQHKQGKLLFSAIRSLRPGGVLVYSTCSFAPEENEAVLDRALKTFGDTLTLEPIPVLPPGTQPALEAWQGRHFAHDLSHARRLLPDERHEAFFVARLRRVR